MTRITVFALALTLACVGAVLAQSPRAQSTSDHFRIESNTVQGKSGQPLVQGYVYTKVLYVSSGVPAGGRGWFETAAPAPGEAFRVSVFSWAWTR